MQVRSFLGLRTGLPILTPSSFSSPGLREGAVPGRTQDIKVTGTATDQQRNLVVEVSNCSADFNQMDNHRVVPRYLLPPGATSGASLSIRSLNSYLEAMLVEDGKNTLSLSGKQKSSVSALNSEVEYQFKLKKLKLVTKDKPNSEEANGKNFFLQFTAEEKTSGLSLLNPLYKQTQKSISGEVEIKKNENGKVELVLDSETFKRYNTNRNTFSRILSAVRSSLELIFIKDIIVESIYVKTANNQLKKIHLGEYMSAQLAAKIIGNENPAGADLESTQRQFAYDLKELKVTDRHINIGGTFSH